MIFSMNLQPEFYNYVTNGTKRIEIRLYDEKRQKINIGDKIKFYKSDSDRLYVRVTNLLKYNNFVELLNDFDISILADKSLTKPKLLASLNKYYPLEQQTKLGVIAIKFEKILN